MDSTRRGSLVEAPGGYEIVVAAVIARGPWIARLAPARGRDRSHAEIPRPPEITLVVVGVSIIDGGNDNEWSPRIGRDAPVRDLVRYLSGAEVAPE